MKLFVSILLSLILASPAFAAAPSDPGAAGSDIRVLMKAITDYLQSIEAVDFIVGTATGDLSAERVCTDTATIDCDMGTAGQAKFNVIGAGVTGLNASNISSGTLPTARLDMTGTHAWTGANSFTQLRLVPVTVATLPASPAANQRATVTDGANDTDCQLGLGSNWVDCRWNNTSGNWEPIGSGSGASTLAGLTAITRTDAVDETTALIIGNGTQCWKFFADSANRARMTNCVASDWIAEIPSGKVLEQRASDGTVVFKIDEATQAITKAKGLVGGFSIPIARDGGLLDTDDFPKVMRAPFAFTITQLCATTDTGTSTVNLQRNDGSAASIAASNITAATTEACTTSFTSGENIISEGHYLDFLMVTAAASGAPTKVTISGKYTRN